MKKNWKVNATSIFVGVATVSTIVLTACSDEFDNTQSTNNQAVTTVPTNTVNAGGYRTVCTDPETGLDMSLTLNNGTVSIKTYDTNGEKESATANLTGADNQTLGTATLSSSVANIKSFTLRKVGAYYLECKAVYDDGTVKEIGFIPETVASRSTGDALTTGAVTTVTLGLKVLLFQCPWLVPITSDLVSLIPGLGDASTDMSVTDCFTQLSSQISALDQKINNLAYEVKTYHDDDQIDAHRQEYNALQINNSTYLNKLASIAAAEESASADSVAIYQTQFNDCLNEWANATTKNGSGYSAAIQYMLNTANGTSDHKVWIKVFDSCAERLFPWEHQAYASRQAFRDRDYVINTESIALLTMYHNTDAGKAVDLTNAKAAFQTIVDTYNAEDNQVVVDSTHAICQIKGANHVMIDKSVFSTYDNPYPTPTGYKPGSDFTNFAVPGNRYTNAVYYAETALLTVAEGEAIVNYYDGKYTFREILEKECGMTCVNEDATDKSVVLPLWKTSTTVTCVKKYYPRRQYRITADKAIYLDDKESTIHSLVLGTYIAWCGDSLWDLITNSDYEFVKDAPVTTCQSIVKVLKIDGRTNDWTPGEY